MKEIVEDYGGVLFALIVGVGFITMLRMLLDQVTRVGGF